MVEIFPSSLTFHQGQLHNLQETVQNGSVEHIQQILGIFRQR